MKRIIAYSSVVHINFALLGYFSNTSYGIVGANLLIISHGIVSASLFLLVGVLYDRHHTRMTYVYGGLVLVIPLFAFFSFIFLVSNFSFPGTSNFVGEILVLVGLGVAAQKFMLILAAVSTLFGVIYSMQLLGKLIFGSLNTKYIYAFRDVDRREVNVLSPIFFLNNLIGIAPNSIISTTYHTVKSFAFPFVFMSSVNKMPVISEAERLQFEFQDPETIARTEFLKELNRNADPTYFINDIPIESIKKEFFDLPGHEKGPYITGVPADKSAPFTYVPAQFVDPNLITIQENIQTGIFSVTLKEITPRTKDALAQFAEYERQGFLGDLPSEAQIRIDDGSIGLRVPFSKVNPEFFEKVKSDDWYFVSGGVPSDRTIAYTHVPVKYLPEKIQTYYKEMRNGTSPDAINGPVPDFYFAGVSKSVIDPEFLKKEIIDTPTSTNDLILIRIAPLKYYYSFVYVPHKYVDPEYANDVDAYRSEEFEVQYGFIVESAKSAVRQIEIFDEEFY